jgi:hypothetical protein
MSHGPIAYRIALLWDTMANAKPEDNDWEICHIELEFEPMMIIKSS